MFQLRSFLAACAVLGALLFVHLAAADPLTVTVSHPPALTLAFDGARGEPLFTPISGTTLLRAVNASVPLVLDPGAGAYYLFASDVCLSAPALTGPWRETMALPASFYGLPETDEARALREFVDARLRASRMRRDPAPNVVLDDRGVTTASSPMEDSWEAMVHPEDAPPDDEALYDDWLYNYGGVAYPWFGSFPGKPIVCHGKHSGFSGPSCSRNGFAHCGGGGGFKGNRLGFGHAALSGTGLGVGTGPGFGYGLGVGCGPGFGNGLGVGSGPGFGNGLGVGSGLGFGFAGGGFGGGFGACR